MKMIPISKLGDTAVLVRSWVDLSLQDSVGDAIDMTGLRDATVQIDGDFGIGKVLMYGSNDGKRFHLLKDEFGFPLSFKKPGIYSLTQNVLFVSPHLDTPDDKTKLSVTICARRIA